MSESRDSYLKRSHGLSDEDYNSQLVVQGYVCAVCKRVNPSKPGDDPQKLAVDHNHRTDANRGVLCRRCNLVLGMLEDSQELLFRLMEYLRHWDGSEMRYPKFPSDAWPSSEVKFTK
jgi:Autographiviridae endonuclease VII